MSEAFVGGWNGCGGGLDSMKLGVVEIRARRGRRNVGGSAKVCHCVSMAVRLKVWLIILESQGPRNGDVGNAC